MIDQSRVRRTGLDIDLRLDTKAVGKTVGSREQAVEGVEAPVFLIDDDDVPDAAKLLIKVRVMVLVRPVGKRRGNPNEQGH